MEVTISYTKTVKGYRVYEGNGIVELIKNIREENYMDDFEDDSEYDDWPVEKWGHVGMTEGEIKEFEDKIKAEMDEW